MKTLEELVELDMLNKCAYEATSQSKWKETTQRYISNLLLNNLKLRSEVLCGEYRVSPTVDFNINERGRIRHIEAPIARDRVVQKTITKNVLTPSLLPHVIYDNYASIKNRGTSFARKRFEIMLRRYIMKNGVDGYVLFIDIKKYFENIDHEVLKKLIQPHICNESQEVINLVHYIIDTSSKANKGLNLGSEAPQVLALYYLTPMDTYVKIVKRIKYYGRYMDDAFVICKSKDNLKALLNEINKVLSELKLEINKKKTHIVKLTHGFTYLQIKYNIFESGKILKRPTRKKIVRERRKLKSLKRLFDENIMSENDVWNCYQSWRGTIVKEHNACYKTLNKMDKLYGRLFPTHIQPKKKLRSNKFTIAFGEPSNIDLCIN